MSAERESQAVEKIVQLLSPFFEISIEVLGAWPLDGRHLRLDILAQPKQVALDMGFDIPAFGIEVKYPQSKESVSKMLDCVMQAYTYNFCEFDGIRPSFVLIYPNIERFFEYDFVNKYNSTPSEQYGHRELRIMRRIMQRANVGELNILPKSYEFRFAGGIFFDSIKGRSKIKGLGINRYIGSGKGYA